MKLSYRSFAAGEVSPRLNARVDQVKYQTGARTMRNFVSTMEGAATNRAGFGYVRPCYGFTAANPPRLLPFVVSDAASYVIVLEHQRLSVINSGTPQFVAASTITGITQANPAVVTTSGAHGLTTGDLVWISGVAGMTQVNQRFFRAVVLSGTTFELEEESGSNVNSTAYTAYGSGGTAQEVYSISTPWDGADLTALRFAQSADVMLFSHPDYPVYKLERTAGPVWTLSAVSFDPAIAGPSGGSITSYTGGASTVRYRVTAVDEETLEESYPGSSTTLSVTNVAETVPDATQAITGITAATPPVVTIAAHGYSNGDIVFITGVGGMTEVNDRYFVVANVAANTFELNDEDGIPVVGAGYTAYTAGGTAARTYRYLITTGSSHGYSDGQEVILRGITTYTSLNETPIIIDVITATTFRTNRFYGTATASVAQTATVEQTSIFKSSATAASSSNPITISWTAVSGALEYNIYREINGVFGYIGTSATASFRDLGYDVDPFDTPPINRDVFAATGDYPAAVGLFQQRLLLGGSTNDLERCDAGRIGLLYNFTKSNPIQSDDSFSWVMRSNKVQSIQHILEMSRCMIFTDSSVWTLEGDDAGSLVPTAINPRKRAEHGLGEVPPLAIGNAVLYVQAFGKIVREILPGSGEDFNAKDLTVYSRHLFNRNAVVSWSYAEEPSSIVWAVRDDGTMLGFTYLREHEVWGWHRHDTGDGDQFIDVCCIPEGAETATYAVVRRYDVGGGDRYYIERMASREIAHQADGRFMDSYRVYEDDNGDVGATYSLHYDDSLGASAWYLVKGGTTPAFTAGDASPDINRVILLYGTNGERYWCTITSIYSTTTAYVAVRTDIVGAMDDDGEFRGAIDSDGAPTDLFPEALPYSTNDWSQSAATINDLWHLEGRVVHVVGDGYPQGPFTVTSGSITLSAPAVLVVAGLKITADLVTLEADRMDGGTWTGRPKVVKEIDVRVEETDGLKIGVSLASLQSWTIKKALEQLPAEGQPYTGLYRANNAGKRSMSGSVYLRQDQGLPCTILGVYPDPDVGA